MKMTEKNKKTFMDNNITATIDLLKSCRNGCISPPEFKLIHCGWSIELYCHECGWNHSYPIPEAIHALTNLWNRND